MADTVKSVLTQAKQELEQAGIDDPLLDARLLLGHILDVHPSRFRAWFLSHDDDPVGNAHLQQFAACIHQRCAGRPVSRIIGSRGFWTLDLAINDHVLDPRPDSESLIDALLSHRSNKDLALQVLDLGTGSGCLLLAGLSEYPNAWGVGVDLSPEAAALARQNARLNGLSDRAFFMAGDWCLALSGRFDIILCNPPYIGRDETGLMNREALDHDPDLALFADNNGFADYERLLPILARNLTADGLVIFECGFRQTARLAELASQQGFQLVEEFHDLGGNPRGLVLCQTT